MNVHVLVFFTCSIMAVQAIPVTRSRVQSSHDKALYREIICIMNGKSPEDCVRDSTLGAFVQNLMDAKERGLFDEESSSSETKPQAGVSLPLPPSSKRDAFYSDWKRRR